MAFFRSRILRIGVMVLLAIGQGCGASLAPRPTSKVPIPYKFVLGPRDIIDVQVWPEDQFSKKKIEVAPDGTFPFPHIGSVKAEGRTPDELGSDIATRLEKFIKYPVVSVNVVEFASSRIHVLGEVHRQGTQPFFSGATAVDAITNAGGFIRSSADLDDVRIIRGKLAEPKVYGLDLYALMHGNSGDTAADLNLQPGDIVYVTETRMAWFRRKVGEVLGLFGGSATGATGVAGGGV